MRSMESQHLQLAIDSLRRNSLASLFKLREYADGFLVGPCQDWILNVVNDEIARRGKPGSEPKMVWLPISEWTDEHVCDAATRLHIIACNDIPEDMAWFIDECFSQAFAEIRVRLLAKGAR